MCRTRLYMCTSRSAHDNDSPMKQPPSVDMRITCSRTRSASCCKAASSMDRPQLSHVLAPPRDTAQRRVELPDVGSPRQQVQDVVERERTLRRVQLLIDGTD